MKFKILIVDDEHGIVDMIQSYFQKQYDILTAYSGQEALQKISSNPDLILLDINMPDIDGLTVCQKIRDYVTCPILFLTARIESSDKIVGFQVGADDYIVKPFAIEELLARIRAVFRRQDAEYKALKEGQNKEDAVGLKLNPQNRSVIRGQEDIPLTKREYDLLSILLSNTNRVLTRKELLSNVWKYDKDVETNVVDVYIRYLRGKLDIPGKDSYIQTVRGMGYIIREN